MHGIGWTVVSVSLYVCLHFKVASGMNTKVGRYIACGRLSACIDPEIEGWRLGHYHLLCCCTCCILSFLMYCCPCYLMCLMYCWWLMLQKLALHVTSYGVYDALSEELRYWKRKCSLQQQQSEASELQYLIRSAYQSLRHDLLCCAFSFLYYHSVTEWLACWSQAH